MRAPLFAAVLLTAACHTFSTHVTRYGPPLPSKQPEQVAVYDSAPPRPYIAIGRIVASIDIMQSSEERWRDHFRKEAAKLGGDAVFFTDAALSQSGATGVGTRSVVFVTPTMDAWRVGLAVIWMDTLAAKSPHP